MEDHHSLESRMRSYIRGNGIIATLTLVAFALISPSTQPRRYDVIPKVENIQSGYVSPNRIGIVIDDFDKTDRKGIPETYIKIDGKLYGLIYNEEGKPELLETGISHKK